MDQPHGSKVKEGEIKDCTIEFLDGKACIIVDADNRKVKPLIDH